MVQVTSEIGRLRRALLHEPGPEVDRMVPAMMEELLFDDILSGDNARDEHARFRRVLQLCGVEVVEANALLAETLEQEAARRFVFEVVLRDLPAELRRACDTLTPEDLAALLVEGTASADGAGPAVARGESLYGVPPLPNWCFQRDPQIVLGDGVIFASMATPARHREALLSRAIFRFHPLLARVPELFDPLDAEHRFPTSERAVLEGGDVLILSADVVAVGLSERTNRSAVRHLARALAGTERGPRRLLLVEIPRRRAYMHLDTLFTLVDRNACLVHAPVLMYDGAEQARVWEIDLRSADLDLTPVGALLPRLAELGFELEAIPCGGSDPVAQQREQWTDGANALALAPGLIALYDRNRATIAELERRGFDIIEAEALLLGREEIDPDSGRRVCILIQSHEISRARGGPHCLVHPLLREAL